MATVRNRCSLSWSARCACRASVTSSSMFTAQTTTPSSPRIGSTCDWTCRRVPSWRSMTISSPWMTRPSRRATAIGERSTGSGEPSGRYIRHEPHHKSTPIIGSRPQSWAAASLKERYASIELTGADRCWEPFDELAIAVAALTSEGR